MVPGNAFITKAPPPGYGPGPRLRHVGLQTGGGDAAPPAGRTPIQGGPAGLALMSEDPGSEGTCPPLATEQSSWHALGTVL